MCQFKAYVNYSSKNIEREEREQAWCSGENTELEIIIEDVSDDNQRTHLEGL